MATVTAPLALMALGTSAATCALAPDVPAAEDELLLDDAGCWVLELLLEQPASTAVPTTLAASATAAAFPARRRADCTETLVLTFRTSMPPQWTPWVSL